MTSTPHVAGAAEIKAARSARITAILFALFAVASAAASRAVGDEHARFSLWIAESGGDSVSLDLPVAIGWIVSALIAVVSAARIWIGGAKVQWRRYLAVVLPILILSILAAQWRTCEPEPARDRLTCLRRTSCNRCACRHHL